MAVVPFARPTKAAEPNTTLQVRSMSDPDARGLVSMLAKSMAAGGHQSVTVALINLRSFLDSLDGFVSPTNIDVRKRGLAAFSDDELRKMLYSGTELQWKEKPAYYRALIEVIRERKIH
jgi:hypothetical protein